MAQLWLSILMPTCNGEAYLPFALNSVIDQQETDIECIVVDDGSTDATLSILHDYQDRLPIKIVQKERQGNWVASTNYALSIAKGKYVCFLHQDDLWFKDRLTTLRQLVEQFPKVDFFLHSCKFIDINNKPLGLWQCPLPSFPEIIKSGLMMEKLLIQNFISIPAPIFKRDIALKVGGLDESLWYTADWDLWLKIAACSDTLYYPKPLAGFRIHPGSQTMVRSSYLQDFRKQLEIVAKKHLAVWDAHESLKKIVLKNAHFSIEANVSMAGIMHGQKPHLFRLIVAFLSLGPSGWFRYFKDSRIFERVFSRLKIKNQYH
jgi:glycosyltransferase involved in cell wall biosynthesis